MKKILILTAAMLFSTNLFCVDTPLLSACKRNDLEAVKVELAKSTADVNKGDVNGSTTPLISACFNGYIEIVRLLLEKGADVNKAEVNSSTPLISACDNGNIAIVRLLLEKGADVNKADFTQLTPLRAAKNNEEIKKLLLDKGAKKYADIAGYI